MQHIFGATDMRKVPYKRWQDPICHLTFYFKTSDDVSKIFEK